MSDKACDARTSSENETCLSEKESCGCGHDHNHNQVTAVEQRTTHQHEACCGSHHHEHSDHSEHAKPSLHSTLSLQGMHCGDCAAKLEIAVSRLPGVDKASVNFATAKMKVEYQGEEVIDVIKKQVSQLGYKVDHPIDDQAVKTIFRIEGMDCADCAQKLQKRVGVLPTVMDVSVNYGAAKMTVVHDGSAITEISEAVRKAGYSATLESGTSSRSVEEASFWSRNQKAVPTLISGALFILGWLLSFFELIPESTSNVFYAAAMISGGYRIAKTGLYGLKSRTIGMDLLMTIAALGAALIGEWEEGAAVVFLFSLGETLEAYTMDRTRRSIRGLMDLSPKEALIRRGSHEMMLPVVQIEINDIMIVKPGSKIAMDGVVVKGASAVNQAPITGESIPVEKQTGDEVFAGTINEHGSLEVRVTRRSQDNTLSRIIHLVEEAQAQKAPSQRFVDVFAKYYTPIVLVVALGIAIIPTVFLNQPFDVWFYRALMMLVVSCPCALVISTPVSIVSAIGNAARNGVLIKGGAHLERLGAINVIAFDKTGTLTRGIPKLNQIVAFGQYKDDELLSVAAAIEKQSEHPVAKAIVKHAQERNIEILESSQFTSVPGKGVQATIQGTTYYIGNPRWFIHDLNVSLEAAKTTIQNMEQQGQTVMILGADVEAIAVFAVSDEIRPESRKTLQVLKQEGIERMVMLTGDNRGTAQAVAAELGEIDVQSELLPQAKLTAVRELMERHGSLAMVGDGVNDAPALATATVGIAMGAAGTDTALETADIALMSDDLSKLPFAIRLSRQALNIIKQNIAFSLLVKAIFLILIFTGSSTLWMAVLADTGSSLIVIANGMRLLKSKP